jgi:hypothetical protein
VSGAVGVVGADILPDGADILPDGADGSLLGADIGIEPELPPVEDGLVVLLSGATQRASEGVFAHSFLRALGDRGFVEGKSDCAKTCAPETESRRPAAMQPKIVVVVFFIRNIPNSSFRTNSGHAYIIEMEGKPSRQYPSITKDELMIEYWSLLTRSYRQGSAKV